MKLSILLTIFLFILFILFISLITLFFFNNYINNYEEFHIKNDKYIIDNNNLYDKEDLIILNKSYQKIPRKIHQTYIDKSIDIKYYETCMINKYMNPEYEYIYYTDSDIENYIKVNFPEYLKAYNMIIPGAYKVDLFRYLVLYKEGGVYIDCKSSTIVPLRKFIKPYIGFVSFKDRLKATIQIGFMASIPKHPLIKKCIDITIENILNKRYGINPFDITGPQVCGRALNVLLNKDELSNIDTGTFNDIDVDIIGSFFTFGKNKYEILADSNLNPLISRTCDSYDKNKKISLNNIHNLIKNEYSVKWTLRKGVYN